MPQEWMVSKDGCICASMMGWPAPGGPLRLPTSYVGLLSLALGI